MGRQEWAATSDFLGEWNYTKSLVRGRKEQSHPPAGTKAHLCLHWLTRLTRAQSGDPHPLERDRDRQWPHQPPLSSATSPKYPQRSPDVNAPRQRNSHSVQGMLNSPPGSNRHAIQDKYSSLKISLHTALRHPLIGVWTRPPPPLHALVPTIVAMLMFMPMLMSTPSPPPLPPPTATAHHPRRSIIHPTIRPIIRVGPGT